MTQTASETKLERFGGRLKSAVVFGIAAISCSTIPAFVTEASFFISLMGSAIIPLSPVIIIEFVVNHMRTSDMPLHTNGFNRNALLVIVAGICIYFIIPVHFSPGFITFLISCMLYFFLVKIRKKSP